MELNGKNYLRAYFIGVGGIGMSALARWFKATGHPVSGYDRTATMLTQTLEQEGIEITYTDSIEAIPDGLQVQPEQTLVVHTPAIKESHPQLKWFKEQEGYTVMKRGEVLGMITANHFSIAVAGTHGKTTTSAILAQLLHFAGCEMAAFLGGIATNFESNLVMQEKGSEDRQVVVEADEYDRAFLQLHPNLAIITSADADHLDIYGDVVEMRNSFAAFMGQIKSGGKLFIHASVAEDLLERAAFAERYTRYSLDSGDLRANNVRVEHGVFRFDLLYGSQVLFNLEMPQPGLHNVENALVACALALDIGLDPMLIREGLAGFRGVKRRFEYVIREPEQVMIDDYAHHPTELRSLLDSVRMLYPEQAITLVFQPHLYSRTRDFADDFALVLASVEELILLPIYPAREEPLEGVSSEMLLARMPAGTGTVLSKEKMQEHLISTKPSLLVMAGAGDIDVEVVKLKKELVHEATK